MSDLAEVFSRLANEPAFADLLRNDPIQALRGYSLSVDDLHRLEAALGSTPPPITTLLSGGRPAGHDET